MNKTLLRQAFLSSDFAAEMKYKPQLAALEAENKALRELMYQIVNYPSLREFAQAHDRAVLGWWLANDLSMMCELLNRVHQALVSGEDTSNLVEEIHETLVELEWEGLDEDESDETE
ncbi:hypothetical protein [Alicyclobacillus fastidiosus]|uniref:Uncharacterized protein n=1 Tax=Alicyclobacillus fastidiosus TaxID=392011 RepID=A0ABV5AK63_9BACL|nr:hypothetical protein [Alicyclobacillus fastidiosus]WEH09297.1 hypothetical protein PYS47_21915 [Alicyclobacillus fastidiosus]